MSNDKKPLMLTAESWSDMEAKKSRQQSHERAQTPQSTEHTQHQNHHRVMQELRTNSKLSRRPYFWAQGGSRDMFTQAVARNVVAISKQQQSPTTKQGPGPLLTPNENIGREMLAHRDYMLKHYQRVVNSSDRNRQTYSAFMQESQQRIDTIDERMKTAGLGQLQDLAKDRLFELDHLKDMKQHVNEYSLQHDLHRDRLEATRQTEVSWPGHNRWGAIKKGMREKPSKLLTLGHGGVQTGFVSEVMRPQRESQKHQFGAIVQSQVDSGLPLNHTAKRLDACHATAKPLKQEMVDQLRQAETENKISPNDRSFFLSRSSSAQQLAQTYHDHGVINPNVKGADTTMARFPNSAPNPTYRNQIETQGGGGRAPRRDHSQTHEPVFRQRPSHN